MGWKAIKDHYRIVHHVQVREGNICIGSGYIGDLIALTPTGEFVKRYSDGSNDDLQRYQAEMDADLDTLSELAQRVDTFEKALPVFTYAGGEILERACERYGWPHCTHDGAMMYENTHFADRALALAAAIKNAKAGVAIYGRMFESAEQQLVQLRNEMTRAEADLAKLLALAEEPSDA